MDDDVLGHSQTMQERIGGQGSFGERMTFCEVVTHLTAAALLLHTKVTGTYHCNRYMVPVSYNIIIIIIIIILTYNIIHIT